MLNIPPEIKKFLLVFLASSFVFFVFAFLQLPDRRFHIYFLNIGQGDSIFIKTPENHQILIDGGPKNFVIEELSEVMSFFDKSIDLIILSHPHADHVDGIAAVLNRYEVKNILFTAVDFDDPSYDEFLSLIAENNIRVFVAESQTDFKFGDVLVDVIFPIEQVTGKKFKNLNNSSVAVKVLYGGKSILLTGDLEEEAEAELVATNIDLKADILKAGHHGSRTSSTREFLQKVRPKIVVIQSGEGNSFGHPHEETLEKYDELGIEKILRNDLDGRIEFVF